MERLLKDTRKLTKLLKKSSGKPIEYMDMAEVLGDLLDTNVYITGPTGKILGYYFTPGYNCPILSSFFEKAQRISDAHNNELLRITDTYIKEEDAKKECALGNLEDSECPYNTKATLIVPLIVCGIRQGTLVITNFESKKFEDRDVIIAEYGATLMAMEILRSRSERLETEAHAKAAVSVAIETLSYSEQEAVESIFNDLDETETVLIASKIADQIGITRSVIVNALRKLESAGVIETKSLGMKGTWIKVTNDYFLEYFKEKK